MYRVLHADDPPHRLALGIALGLFVTFLPAIGLQMVLVVFLAWLCRANKLVGLPLVWISNPVTFIPIYYPCYVLGCKFLGMPVVSDEWDKLTEKSLSPDVTATLGSRIRFWWDSVLDFAGPLGLGCLVVASVVGILSYYISLFAIRSYRLRRWGQLMPPGLTPEDHDATVIPSKSSSGENAA